MRSLQDAVGTTFHWAPRPPPPRKERKFIHVQKAIYELTQAGEAFATLEWLEGSGNQAIAHTVDAAFRFSRGRSRAYATVSAVESDSDLAEIASRRVGSLRVRELWTLTFQDGRQYGFSRRGKWKAVWTFTDGKGQLLCRLLMGGLRSEGEFVLEVEPQGHPDLALIVLVGWYVAVQERLEAEPVTIELGSPE